MCCPEAVRSDLLYLHSSPQSKPANITESNGLLHQEICFEKEARYMASTVSTARMVHSQQIHPMEKRPLAIVCDKLDREHRASTSIDVHYMKLGFVDVQDPSPWRCRRCSINRQQGARPKNRSRSAPETLYRKSGHSSACYLVPGPWSLVPGPWSLVPGPWSLGCRSLQALCV